MNLLRISLVIVAGVACCRLTGALDFLPEVENKFSHQWKKSLASKEALKLNPITDVDGKVGGDKPLTVGKSANELFGDVFEKMSTAQKKHLKKDGLVMLTSNTTSNTESMDNPGASFILFKYKKWRRKSDVVPTKLPVINPHEVSKYALYYMVGKKVKRLESIDVQTDVHIKVYRLVVVDESTADWVLYHGNMAAYQGDAPVKAASRFSWLKNIFFKSPRRPQVQDATGKYGGIVLMDDSGSEIEPFMRDVWYKDSSNKFQEVITKKEFYKDAVESDNANFRDLSVRLFVDAYYDNQPVIRFNSAYDQDVSATYFPVIVDPEAVHDKFFILGIQVKVLRPSVGKKVTKLVLYQQLPESKCQFIEYKLVVNLYDEAYVFKEVKRRPEALKKCTIPHEACTKQCFFFQKGKALPKSNWTESTIYVKKYEAPAE